MRIPTPNILKLFCGLAIAAAAVDARAEEPQSSAPSKSWAAEAYRRCDTWAQTMAALRTAVLEYRGPLQPGGNGEPREGPQPARAGLSAMALWRQLERDFPVESDWMLQDLAACGAECWPEEWDGGCYPARWFTDEAEDDIEPRMILRVAEELGTEGDRVRAKVDRLQQAQAIPHGREWLELYAAACRTRRELRLRPMLEKCRAFMFTKHYNMGGSHYAYTEGQSDAQAERHFTPGAALCLLEMDGPTPKVRTLLADPDGVIRDPEVSYDGRRVLFAWKKSDRLDDYHLHELDLASGRVRQLTFGLGFADYEGAYLPDGDILFNSTRCVQTVDCFTTEVSNLYTCDKDGRYLRRLGFDQVHSNFPTVTEDGRVLYTRWEYNDRGQIYPQALFQMNSDGTGQTEFYGNNSWFPTTILHARNIFGTQKVLAIATGHHSRQTGKLIVVDPARGRQENSGVQLVAPVQETPAEHVDSYGQDGELFQYPYPLGETEFLVTYSPWGWARQPLLFGIYFTTLDGRRELLAADAEVSCNQAIPLRRPAPRVRPNMVDYAKTTGTFYLQDVYAGPGLAGVPRGKAKRLRVVALDFRAAVLGGNHNHGVAGAAFVATPVAIACGCWDPKIVLGETPLGDDGSAFFTVPARTPVYFQVLDEKGYVIQTMRSWSTLQPGENASCVGCHEAKNSVPLPYSRDTLALRRGPQALEPFYGPPRGFSFSREIQPILDRHCTTCHDDRSRLPLVAAELGLAPPSGPAPAGDQKSFSLLGEESVDAEAKRRFSDAYLALTGAIARRDKAWEGVPGATVNWISPQSAPPMLPPYTAGAATSGLMTLLEQGHKDVKLSREEMEKLACWIDLVVPYAGDYIEANAWSPEEKERYDYFLAKRRKMAELEAENVRQWMFANRGQDPFVQSTGSEPAAASLESAVVLSVEVEAADGTMVAHRKDVATPASPVVLEVPRRFRPGDRVRVRGAQHLAIRLDPAMGESAVFAPEGLFELAIPLSASAAPSAATAYAPQALRAERPQISARPLAARELGAYRNLALSPFNVRGAAGVFPHTSTDSEGGDDWQVDFGREVEIDKVVVLLRADLPRDEHRRQLTFLFSDGGRHTVALEKTPRTQTFTLEPRITTWLRLADLVQDEAGRGAIAGIEVWGRDPIAVGDDLAAAPPASP